MLIAKLYWGESVVAVHGLNATDDDGIAYLTWTASNGKMWLRDFLPRKLPKARILLFGYNSNVAFEASVAGIVAHAGNLLNWLILKRRVGLIILSLYRKAITLKFSPGFDGPSNRFHMLQSRRHYCQGGINKLWPQTYLML